MADLAAVRAWREDNPRATFPYDAFGTTWDMPVGITVDVVLMLKEAAEQGRVRTDQLTTTELLKMARGTLGDDLFTQWTDPDLGIEATEFFAEAGRAYRQKLERARSGEAEAGGDRSATTTSSGSGTSSTTTSPASTEPESDPT